MESKKSAENSQPNRKTMNEYVNSSFTLESGSTSLPSGPKSVIAEAKNAAKASSDDIQLKPINPNFNKTLPADQTMATSSSSPTTSCTCIANKLGMDAKRLSKFYTFFMAFFATIAITCSIFLIKLSTRLNASEMASIKFLTQLLFCLPFAYFYRQNVFGPVGARLWLVLRGMLGAASIIAAYFSIKMIRFGDSMAIRYSSPVVTALFARLFLKEKFRLIHLASFALSVLGVLFIIRPSVIFGPYGQSKQVESSLYFVLGTTLAILSALSAGTTFVFIKKLTNQNIHFTIIIYYFSLIGLALSVLISVVLYAVGTTRHNLSLEKHFILKDVSMALLAGLINFVGHVCFTLAIAKENANNMAILRTMDILVAFLLEFVVLDLTPHWLTFSGAGLILVSVVVVFVYKIILYKRQRRSALYEDQANNEMVFRI